jgi:predicted AlkP superfamily pyrophosphatase or phosphodiesterase
MTPLLVLDVVGLTAAHLGPDTPHLTALAGDGFSCPLTPVLPAVTCPVQSTILTGTLPRSHGIVGNGWYFRDLAEVWFWRQSNRLVAGEMVWDAARARFPGLTTAQLFWWHNMCSSVEISLTPRPAYPADGRKLPDAYGTPPGLARELQAELGPFPLFRSWGPKADIVSTRWIVAAALRVLEMRRPGLALVYLPHLDYALQLGPAHPAIAAELRAVDAEAGRLIAAARAAGYAVAVLSEYGISPVRDAVHLNRILRQAGLLTVHEPCTGGELLDAGASRAFAVADHQVAHVYVREPADLPAVKRLLEATAGVEQVLDAEGKGRVGLDHPRAGELVAVAAPERWFSYYYWLDDDRAPDFARTVDIHRKPGYDPVELFLDPARPLMPLRIAGKLARKALGFRTLMDVIPLDARLVKGSHGRLPATDGEGPMLLCSEKGFARDRLHAVEVKGWLLEVMGGGR